MLSACASQPRVKTGLEALAEDGFAPLEGMNVGLITNHTGLDSKGNSTADILSASKKFKLAAMFCPEHGLAGVVTGGEKVGNACYGADKIPVYSLYGATLRPTYDMLKNLDIMVFDIQDIGARFYTYLATMAQAMEAADKYAIPFFVLDRPNPITGTVMEGPVLDKVSPGLTAYLPVPVRHGMTAGEIALMYADAKKLRLAPEVIKMKGWKREMWYDETGLPWVNPSPNIRDIDAEILYPGLGCFESTNISVGRGTASPFHWIGAPWLDAKTVIGKLEKSGMKGVKLVYEERTPADDIYAGTPCKGIRFEITNREKLRPLEIYARVLCILRDMKAGQLKVDWDSARRMTGTADFQKLYAAGAPPEKILESWQKSLEKFAESRKKYLLY